MRISALLLLALAIVTNAHLELVYPPPLRSKHNSFTTQIDYDMKSPMTAGGADYPCKGHLSVLSSSQGGSVASWAAGSQQTWTIEGGTRHNGGSCQASISKDGGRTFKVVHSYIGKCPLKDSQNFKVPADTPPGPAIFAWSWFNNAGNREEYMNCASITITGKGGRESISFNSRPNILRANTGTDCSTVGNTDAVFPDPGPDVTVDPDAKQQPPTGRDCGPSGPQGGGGSVSAGTGPSGGDAGADYGSGPFGSGSDAPFTPGDIPSGGGGGGGSSGLAPPVDFIPGLIPSVNGVCGQQYTCINSILGGCCSAQGRCGTSDEDCGAGCNRMYGRCTDSRGNSNTYTGRRGNAQRLQGDWWVRWMAAVVIIDAL